MARGRGTGFLWPLVRGEQHAEIDAGVVRLRYGRLGSFAIPVERVERIGTMRWPWWAGIGARIAYRMVAFTGIAGRVALLELDGPMDVRAPFRWSTSRVAVGVADVDEFMRAVAHERARRTAELRDAATAAREQASVSD